MLISSLIISCELLYKEGVRQSNSFLNVVLAYLCIPHLRGNASGYLDYLNRLFPHSNCAAHDTDTI